MNTIAILVICLGVAVFLLAFVSKRKLTYATTHEEVAKAIEDFLEERGGDHDWDDFLHWNITDLYLESVRKKCCDIYDEYPATKDGHYCSEEGFKVLRELLDEVRAKSVRR